MKQMSLSFLVIALVMGMFAGSSLAASPGVYVEEVTYLRLPAQLGGDELFPLIGDEVFPRTPITSRIILEEGVGFAADDRSIRRGFIIHELEKRHGIAGPIRQLITWGDVGLALSDRTTTKVMPGDNVTISELTRDTIQAPVLEVMVGMGQKDAGG
jgi:hypothetical protein